MAITIFRMLEKWRNYSKPVYLIGMFTKETGFCVRGSRRYFISIAEPPIRISSSRVQVSLNASEELGSRKYREASEPWQLLENPSRSSWAPAVSRGLFGAVTIRSTVEYVNL